MHNDNDNNRSINQEFHCCQPINSISTQNSGLNARDTKSKGPEGIKDRTNQRDTKMTN